MKYYNLEYDFHGGKRSLQTTSVEKFSEYLEEALNNIHLTPGSIVIWTEVKK